jgi:hypothetical protein
MHSLGLALLFLVKLAAPGHAGNLERRQDETLPAYAKRILPSGAELASKAVELKLGALGNVSVILFMPNKDATNYTGWVLIPEASDARSYRKVVLPPLTVANGLFDIDVKSIFSADVDGDGNPELCVLSHYYRNGSGEEPYPATDCFRWSGKKFELVEASAPLSVGLRTAKAVRTHFAKHPVKPGTGLPGSKAP